MKTSIPISPQCMQNSCKNEGSGVVKGGELCPAVDVDEGAPGSKRSRVDEGEGSPEEVQDQGESEEARTMRAPPIPSTPSKEEVRQHRLTVPFVVPALRSGQRKKRPTPKVASEG